MKFAVRTALAAIALSAGLSAAHADVADADRVAIAEAAVAAARPSLNCRYAFQLDEKAQNTAIWATTELKLKQKMQFDPRRELDYRWKVLETSRGDRVVARRQMNSGSRSNPHTDLLTVTLEGDLVIGQLRFDREQEGQWVFKFEPKASTAVDPQAQSFFTYMRGELWLDPATKSITRRVLELDEPMHEGRGSVKKGTFTRWYAPSKSGMPLVTATEQKMDMTIKGRGIQSAGSQKITAVEPVCDRAEVLRIIDMEETNKREERSEYRPGTGSRLRPD